MKPAIDKHTLGLMRVIGGWILVFGSTLVAIEVTLAFFDEFSCVDDPGPTGKYVVEVKRADPD